MVPVVSSVQAIMEMVKNLLKEMTETAGMAELLGSAEAIEVVNPSGQEVSISDAQPVEVSMEISKLARSSAIDSLRIVAEFLKGHLSPADRQALDGEGAHCQMAGSLRSLALIGHYLASFTGVTSRVSSLELIEAKKEIDRLKYQLEQEKIANADLIKEIDCSKKTLFDAQEKIDHRDDEIDREESESSKDIGFEDSSKEESGHDRWQFAHYLNEFMEDSVDLSTKTTRFELEASMLKTAKDTLSRAVGEAFDRVDAAEKKVQDAETALMRFAEENAQLLGINKALDAEVEELIARSANAEASEAKALKMAKEKMAMLICDMEARAEATISRAIDDFRASKEFKDEKALFGFQVSEIRSKFIR
ncbi:putative paramyosin-like [Cocos nucifera]|uniref:Putative paramyosin-like n=1 Tax=Cocos nucifera TaxID=13894 RepID=A0A8K0MWM2_COCNU|nr:putative paramyosin-like [Cocos nucifera]